MNIIEGLQKEMNRNRELLINYAKIPTGGFGAMMIRANIKDAEKAITDGDPMTMIMAYKKLSGNK